MKIFQFDYQHTPINIEKSVLCLGFFDGVHIGHQSIIEKAKNEGYKVSVLTFDEAPAYVLGRIKENHYLTSVSDKAEILENLGVDCLYIMEFNRESAMLTKDEFINKVIRPLNPAKLFCGEDYSFGARGEGDPFYLSLFFDVEVVETKLDNGKKISARDISRLIEKGDIELANQLLGRPFRLNGLVVEGKHNGRKIDFPTANLKLDYPYAFPKSGVYFGYAYVDDVKYKAIVAVGIHPTIMPLSKPIIEVHILGFDGIIYGKDIFVELLIYQRDIKQFASLEDLKEQLKRDKNAAIKKLK